MADEAIWIESNDSIGFSAAPGHLQDEVEEDFVGADTGNIDKVLVSHKGVGNFPDLARLDGAVRLNRWGKAVIDWACPELLPPITGC